MAHRILNAVNGWDLLYLVDTLPQVTFNLNNPATPTGLPFMRPVPRSAQMSGVAKYIDMVMRDMEDTEVLGLSAQLAHALRLCAATA